MDTIYDAKLLLVDDNAELLALLCEQLRGAGYGHIRTAQSCAAARACFAAEQPELMILDINLPDGDGFSLFRALRAPLGQLPLQVWEVLLLVWAAGSLGLAARTGLGAWKFHKKLRSYEPLEDSRIERLAQQAARELDMPAPLLIQTLRADTPVQGSMHT